jgi:hypothetical protein
MDYMYIYMYLEYIECNTGIDDCEMLHNIKIFKIV